MNTGYLHQRQSLVRHSGLPENSHLYMCLQNLLKIHPDFDSMLAGILRDDPEGVVVLLGGRTPYASDLLKQRFSRTLPDVMDRIVFVPRMPAKKYMQMLSLADAVIDPPHFGAGITTYDIFSLNLPVVALPGEYCVSRCTSGCYEKIGFTELVASSQEEYVAKAIQVATDFEYRQHAVTEIQQRSDVLFEDINGVREFERFFREIHLAGGR